MIFMNIRSAVVTCNAEIWRCGLRALLIAIKVAYLPVHSKYQVRTALIQMKNPHEQERVESTSLS